MLNDETLKIKLLLDYEISELYLKSGASTKMISDITGVSLSSIKRALNTINDKMDDYERLLPDLLTRDTLEQMALELKELIAENKRSNRWASRELSVDEYSEEINRIKYLKNRFDSFNTITEGEKSYIVNLRVNGDTFREISRKTGRSLSTIESKLKEESVKIR